MDFRPTSLPRLLLGRRAVSARQPRHRSTLGRSRRETTALHGRATDGLCRGLGRGVRLMGRGRNSVGRMPASQAGRRGFESHRPLSDRVEEQQLLPVPSAVRVRHFVLGPTLGPVRFPLRFSAITGALPGCVARAAATLAACRPLPEESAPQKMGVDSSVLKVIRGRPVVCFPPPGPRQPVN